MGERAALLTPYATSHKADDVQDPSRQQLRSVANCKGIRVIDGALRGKDPEVYVRDELLPALQRAIE